MEKATCSGCGVVMAANAVLYTTEAKPVCQKCYAGADIVETDKRAGHHLKTVAAGALGMALLSIVFNPVYLTTVGSTISALYALRSLASSDDVRFTKHLGPGDKTLIIICAGLAMVMTAIVALLAVIGWFNAPMGL